MAEKRTEKHCYESRYGGGWITANQRLAEMACERQAGDVTLGTRFWMNPPWTNLFRQQVTHASKLLSHFSVDAIMKALVSPRGRNVKSLGAPFFRPLVEIEQRQLELTQKTLDMAPLPEPVNTLETPRPVKRAGKSIREKLRENGPSESVGGKVTGREDKENCHT